MCASASDFAWRVGFEELVGTPDAVGGEVLAPEERFECWARFVFLRGGESVLAGRLAGRQVTVVTVRRSSTTAALTIATTTRWQIRDKTTDMVYNIRAVEPNREKPRQFLDFLCESKT
nr:head-tail adaptor protein [Thiosulfatihalobacter marinus]